MKTAFAIAVGTLVLLAAGTPWAQDTKRKRLRQVPAATAQSGSAMNMGSQMAQMDEHMQMMKALHEKKMAATTPEARRIVAERQGEEMQACMGMVSQMHGGEMMGGAGGGMMAQKGTLPDATAQMQMVQKRMEMMEMRMQTMMDQQDTVKGGMAPALR